MKLREWDPELEQNCLKNMDQLPKLLKPQLMKSIH